MALEMTWRRLWAGSGVLAVVLFACGLLFGDLLGASNYPPLNASPQRVTRYFVGNADNVRVLGFFHLLAALALLAFAAYLAGWLRRAEEPAGSLAGLALAGGIAAATFLLLSALLYRTLAEPEVARDRALAHALVVLSYLAGGPAAGVPLALPVGAGALAALRGAPSLPRWTGQLGIAAALISIVSAASLLGPMNNSSLLYGVLLLAAVLGFAWIAVTSVLLARAA
jgi:hypothetical protein